MKCDICGAELAFGGPPHRCGDSGRWHPPYVTPPTGWICPKCGVVNAPHITSCPCVPVAFPDMTTTYGEAE